MQSPSESVVSTARESRFWRRFLMFVGVMFAAMLLLPDLASAQPQTIFLPTVRNFMANGSVRVPDGGTALIGGASSSSGSSISRGVPGLGGIPGIGRGFRNRGIGRAAQSGNLTAKATILDMKELEAEHLAKAGYGPNGQRFATESSDVLAKAAFLSQHVGRRKSTETGRSRPARSSQRNR